MIIHLTNFTTTSPTIVVTDDQGRAMDIEISDSEGGYLIAVREFDPVSDMAEFHQKFDLKYGGKARALVGELRQFRTQFMGEELEEYDAHAVAAEKERTLLPPVLQDPGNYTYHLEGMLDALVDLTYVAIGTAYLHGFNFKEAWRRVHIANMNKVRAERPEDSKRGSTFDVVKPPGWEAPSHLDLVEINDLKETNES